MLSMILMGVLPLALLVFLSSYQSNHSLKKVIGSSFQALAQENANNIDSILSNEIKILSTLAKSSVIVQAVQSQDQESSDSIQTEGLVRKEVEKLLEIALDTNPIAKESTLGFFLTDLNGVILASTSLTSPEFQQEQKKLIHNQDNPLDILISDIYKSPIASQYLFRISVALKDIDGRPIGFLHRMFSAKEYFSPHIDSIQFGEMGHLMLIDSRGIVIDCPMFATGHQLDSADLIQTVASSNPGWAQTSGNGHGYKKASMVGFSPLKTTNGIKNISSGHLWHTFAWEASDTVFAESNALRKWIMSAGAVSALMVLIMGVYVSGRIVKPIVKLREATERMSRGENPEEIEITSSNEIGALANSFNKMFKDLHSSRISEQKNYDQLNITLEKLRQSKTYNQAILDHAVDSIILIDEKGVVETFNPAAEKLFKYEASEIIGKSVNLIIPEPEKSKHDGYLEKYIKTGKANIIGFDREVVGQDKDGLKMDLELAVGEVWINDQRRFVGILHDITKRKEMESQLETLSRAVDQSPGATMITDVNGNIEYVNPSFITVSGYSLSELLGKNPRILKSGKQSPEFYQKLWQTISSGKEWKGEFCNKKKNGELYWELKTVVPIRNREWEITHFLSVTIDDTGRKRAEEKLKKHAVKLEQANETLKEFASVTSHDLQEPLRKILLFGDRLKEQEAEQLGEKSSVYLGKILGSAQRMKNLITDLLTYGEISNADDRFESVDLDKIVEEVLDDLEIMIDRAHGKVEIEQPLPLIIADRVQMRQLWQNLISNAIKYKKKEEAPRIKIRHRKVEDKWEFEVEDNGIGFELKYMDRMTKPFQRLHTKDEIEGTGIGLAICRKIISQHGGKLTARSEPGKGSTFIFQLGQKQHEKQEL